MQTRAAGEREAAEEERHGEQHQRTVEPQHPLPVGERADDVRVDIKLVLAVVGLQHAAVVLLCQGVAQVESQQVRRSTAQRPWLVERVDDPPQVAADFADERLGLLHDGRPTPFAELLACFQ